MRKKRNYFNEDTEQAVLDYMEAESQIKKNRIFNEHLYTPLLKMTEVMINSGSYPYALAAADPGASHKSQVKQLQTQAICHILSVLHNYKKENGKAYSYFTVIINYYLINTNKAEYKKLKEQSDIDTLSVGKHESMFSYETEKPKESLEFLESFISYFENNILFYFPKQRDYAIANAFLEILKRRDVLPVFQKKKLYLFIREQTNCKQQDITSVFNRIKKISAKAFNDYYDYGCLNRHRIYKEI